MAAEAARGPGWFKGGRTPPLPPPAPSNSVSAICKKLCTLHCQDRSELLKLSTSIEDISNGVRQDLLKYRTDRAMDKIAGIAGFDEKYLIWLFKRCKKETLDATEHSTEPGPANFGKDNLDDFSYDAYYDYLLENHPTLMYSLAGTMMAHQGPEDIQVPYRYGFGGKRKSNKISLKASLCLAAGQALHVGHPRSFNTIQNVTSVLFAASRLPGPLTGLANQLGLSQGMDSGNSILDKLLKSVQDPILDMKREVEDYHAVGRRCKGTKGMLGPAGFTCVSDNVSLESVKPRQNTGLEYQGKSLHMTQSMGYINRVKTGEISPADVVMKERYRASRDEVMQTDRWEEMAVRRSLTSTTQFRRFRNTVRPPVFRFQEVMSKKSEDCMLGLEMANPASSHGMIKVLTSLQRVVPVIGQDNQQTTVVWCDQNFYERADQETWTLSDEISPRARMSGLLPMPQLWHKRQKDLMVHNDKFNRPELLKVPGSLANTKEVFSLNQASKDCKNFEASWQHMELSADILLNVLAQEAMSELNVKSETATKEDFNNIVRSVFKKVQLATQESLEDISDDQKKEDDDQLRSFLLDQVASAVRLKAQKLATQHGDGDSLITFWKLSLLVYHETNSYKYRIAALRLIMAAEGVFGEKIRYDVRYNWGVNVKGLPGHNVEGDVHLEHHQGYFKAAASTLGGMYTEQGLKRSSDSLHLKSAALAKLYPVYMESGDLTARPPAVGHRKGDWSSTVALGVQRMGISSLDSSLYALAGRLKPFTQDMLSYTPERIYARRDKKGNIQGPYQRRRVLDLSGLKKWAPIQARELKLKMRDMH